MTYREERAAKAEQLGWRTLAEWASEDRYAIKVIGNGEVVIPDVGRTEERRAELWRLRDHIVTSVIGGSVWLRAL